jgi:hypothetical protein
LFAREFDSSITASMSSLGSILREVALQNPRAAEIQPAALVEKLN